jgi:hypothetical protein
MDASDLIKALQNTLRGGGRPHMGLGRLRAPATQTRLREVAEIVNRILPIRARNDARFDAQSRLISDAR